MEWKDLSNRTGKKTSLKVVRYHKSMEWKRVLRHQNSETVKKRTE